MNPHTELQWERSEQSNGGPPHGLGLLDLFRRDFYFWWRAIYRNWWILLLSSLAGASLLYFFRTLNTENLYISRCSLMRQGTGNLRGTHVPDMVTLPQMDVVLRLMVSRPCLEDTIGRLKLQMTPEQLFQTIQVQQASKNSNYLYVTATTDSPDLSARIANTLAEVFLSQYIKLLHGNLVEPRESIERNLRILRGEIKELQESLIGLNQQNKIDLFDRDRDTLEGRIVATENRYQREQSELQVIQTKLADLRVRIDSIPEQVVLYQEINTASERHLANLKLELSELLQRYTEANPRVIRQRELIREFEANPETPEDSGVNKVVMGKNPERTSLQLEIAKLETSQGAQESILASTKQQLDDFYLRREVLTSLVPEYKQINSQIKTKQSLLDEQESLLQELSMFQDRKYSDISIYEDALANTNPLPRQRTLFAAIGFVLGLMISSGTVLSIEALNLSARSKTDLEMALHLNTIGVLPLKTPATDAQYYSALQTIVVKSRELTHSFGTNRMLAIAPVGDHEKFSEHISEIFRMLNIKGVSCLRIRPAQPMALNNALLINDFLYGITDQLPVPNARGEIFFNLDDMALITPVAQERLHAVAQKAGCELICWELFPCERHPQLYADICGTAALTLLTIRCGYNSKLQIRKMMKYLEQHEVRHLYAVLYDIDPEIYEGVGL